LIFKKIATTFSACRATRYVVDRMDLNDLALAKIKIGLKPLPYWDFINPTLKRGVKKKRVRYGL